MKNLSCCKFIPLQVSVFYFRTGHPFKFQVSPASLVVSQQLQHWAMYILFVTHTQHQDHWCHLPCASCVVKLIYYRIMHYFRLMGHRCWVLGNRAKRMKKVIQEGFSLLCVSEVLCLPTKCASTFYLFVASCEFERSPSANASLHDFVDAVSTT